MRDKCYICLIEDCPLIKPCVNPSCKAKIHQSCLSLQYKTVINCGICRSDIIKRSKFNPLKCFRFLYYWIFTPILAFIIYVKYLYVILSLSFNSSIHNMDHLEHYLKENKRDDMTLINMIISLILTIPFFLHIFGSFVVGDLAIIQEYNKEYGLLVMSSLVSITPMLCVLFCDLIGYSIRSYLLGVDDSFNWMTSLGGSYYLYI